MVYFLNWWVIFNLVLVGSVFSYFVGVFDLVNKADVTKISFLIYILFLIFSIRTGVYTRKISKVEDKLLVREVNSKQDLTWFVSDVLLTLGMLGTVLGYIYMIEVGFSSMDPSNFHSLTASLKTMAIGWGTALYTTAAGLICSVILKLQLFNISKLIEKICPPDGNCEISNSKVPLGEFGV